MSRRESAQWAVDNPTEVTPQQLEKARAILAEPDTSAAVKPEGSQYGPPTADEAAAASPTDIDPWSTKQSPEAAAAKLQREADKRRSNANPARDSTRSAIDQNWAGEKPFAEATSPENAAVLEQARLEAERERKHRKYRDARGGDPERGALNPLTGEVIPYRDIPRAENDPRTPEQIAAEMGLDVSQQREILPDLKRPGATSKGDFMRARLFYEPSAEEAQRALERPEIRRLALTHDDVMHDPSDPDSEPIDPRNIVVKDGSPLHQRINDAVWALTHDKNELDGMSVTRVRDIPNQTVMGRFARSVYGDVVEPLGELALQFDKGVTGGLLQSGVAAIDDAASEVAGQPAHMREMLNETNTGFEERNPNSAGVAQIAGAVSPNSIGSRVVTAGAPLVNAAGRYGFGMRALASGLVGAGVGAADEAAHVGAEVLSGRPPTPTFEGDESDGGVRTALNRIAESAAVGGVMGGFGDMVAQGATRLMRRMENANHDYIHVGRAGGKVGPVRTVELPPRLQKLYAEAGDNIRSGRSNMTASDMAANRAGDFALRGARRLEDEGKALGAQQDAELYAAAGSATVDTTAMVNKIANRMRSANATFAAQQPVTSKEFLKLFTPRAVKAGTPGALKADAVASMVGGAEFLPKLADDIPGALGPGVTRPGAQIGGPPSPNMLGQGPLPAGSSALANVPGASSPQLSSETGIIPGNAMVEGPGVAQQVFGGRPGAAAGSEDWMRGGYSQQYSSGAPRRGSGLGATETEYLLVPKHASPADIDEVLNMVAKRAKDFEGKDTGASEFWKGIYADGQDLRTAFSAHPGMNAVANKHGAKNYADLKRMQSQQIEGVENVKRALRVNSLPEMTADNMMSAIDPLRAAEVRAAIKAGGVNYEEAFKVLKDTEPKLAQALADSLGIEAAERLQKGGVKTFTTGPTADPRELQSRVAVGAETLRPRAYGLLGKLQEPIREGVDWAAVKGMGAPKGSSLKQVPSQDWWKLDQTREQLLSARKGFDAASQRVASQVSADDAAAFADYAKGTGHRANSLRTLGKNEYSARYGAASTAETSAKSKKLDAALKRALNNGHSYTGNVYRGTVMPKGQLDKWIAEGSLETPTVTSTTISPALSEGFLVDHVKPGKADAQVIFHFGKETKGVPIAGLGLSGEKEVLIPSGKKFTISEHGVDDRGVTHLFLQPDNDPWGPISMALKNPALRKFLVGETALEGALPQASGRFSLRGGAAARLDLDRLEALRQVAALMGDVLSRAGAATRDKVLGARQNPPAPEEQPTEQEEATP